MRLYAPLQKVAALDDGSIEVHGIASTKSTDHYGEIIKADAIREALPAYLEFPALREMHSLSAAGSTIDMEVGADNITRITAHVVDPVAVLKCKSGVYRGFSIGGKTLARDPKNSKVITKIRLDEVSLVDRPANANSKLLLKAVAAPDRESDKTAVIRDVLAGMSEQDRAFALIKASHKVAMPFNYRPN